MAGMSCNALAAKDGLCKDGTPRPCKPEGGGKPPTESGVNNLSYPLILSDNASPAGFPQDAGWRFATIASTDQCIGEDGVTATPGEPVPVEYLCYYGRHTTVSNDEGSVGEVIFDGPYKVWWLQKRTQNFWKALSVGHNVTTPLVVSAVDVGDLLESTPSIQTRQIRVEFNLLQNVPVSDPELGQYVVADWTDPVPSPCTVPSLTGDSIGCFAALGMSGAVPGTEQSGNETQGTDFGPGPSADLLTGTLTLLDPTTIRTAVPADGSEAIPIHALVYSNCARLVIQKIDGEPNWDQATGRWSGPGVGAPVVNLAAYAGAWSTEITSGGSIVYGYNWNAKTVATGKYRLTMVLDGNDNEGPVCGNLATEFDDDVTKLVNQGENNLSTIIYAGDSDLGDEGGLVYIDLELTGGGGGGGNPGGGKP